jgi:ankyrin repeat protein
MTSRSLSLSVCTSEDSLDNIWYCHCCIAQNIIGVTKCKVCGRDQSYGLSGYPLPFHGNNAKLYRPNQLLDVMEDIHETDSEKWTALHVACANGNIALVKQLIAYKAQLDAVTNKGQTALHLAVYCGSTECVMELLKHKVNIRVSTFTEKQTPLHMACERGFARITQLLIQAGADVNARNILGRTPLHCAAVVGRCDIALLLLRAGAALKQMDAHGWEPCQIAELNNHRELQELFIREAMTEKQAVFKELPPAPWHSDVWFEVVRMQTQRKSDHDRAMKAAKQDEENTQLMREEARLRQLEERKNARRLEIQQYKASLTAYEYKRK